MLTAEFVDLLRDWSVGIFIVAIALAGALQNAVAARRSPTTGACEHCRCRQNG